MGVACGRVLPVGPNRSRAVTSQAFPTLFHEIFNEPEKAEVFAVLAAWLSPPERR